MIPLEKKYLIISVIGTHAGEDISQILFNKQKELESKGRTYWLLRSFRAKTLQIQKICEQATKERDSIYCLFINPSRENGARPTTHNSKVKYVSENGNNWRALPKGVKITGKVDRQSTALVLNELYLTSPIPNIDLWKFSEFETDDPLKLQLGASTICCKNIPSKGMQSRYRDVIAFGKLIHPYAVYVK